MLKNFFNELTEKIFSSKKLLLLIILGNLIGTIYGFVFYYGPKLIQTPLHLWLFVPDCPLFSLLVAISFLLILLKKESSLVFFFTVVGALKYGFWTVFVLLYYNNFYFTPENSLMYLVLLIAHIFLFIESFVLIKKIDFKFFYLVPVLVFFLANDFFDYLFNTHPSLPLTELNFVFYFTLITSLIFISLALILVKFLNKENKN